MAAAPTNLDGRFATLFHKTLFENYNRARIQSSRVGRTVDIRYGLFEEWRNKEEDGLRTTEDGLCRQRCHRPLRF